MKMLLLLTACLVALFSSVAGEVVQKSSNMAPTVLPGTTVKTKPVSSGKIRRWDIVVAEVTHAATPLETPHTFLSMSRVVGLPGEKVVVTNSIVYINGRELRPPGGLSYPPPEQLESGDETYYHGKECVVPSGRFFLIGDNSKNSVDSRAYGPVAFSAIKGRVVLKDKKAWGSKH